MKDHDVLVCGALNLLRAQRNYLGDIMEKLDPTIPEELVEAWHLNGAIGWCLDGDSDDDPPLTPEQIAQGALNRDEFRKRIKEKCECCGHNHRPLRLRCNQPKGGHA